MPGDGGLPAHPITSIAKEIIPKILFLIYDPPKKNEACMQRFASLNKGFAQQRPRLAKRG
jgi:hypothetical protein